ncbi:hypothetical protein RB195_005266 [Necator americanus]|uniref:Uncharacterized protein n=1 Tax=Necator americanus TaxID=51031 RepID=A0ABR1BLZ9_NECAM
MVFFLNIVFQPKTRVARWLNQHSQPVRVGRLPLNRRAKSNQSVQWSNSANHPKTSSLTLTASKKERERVYVSDADDCTEIVTYMCCP